MDALLPFILLIAGLVLLAGGGELLVRGATQLARIAGMSTAVIGLTVVAMGTSLPELAVGTLAVLEGQPDIAVGNVVGSNIFNITAALGITALIQPLPVRGAAVRLEWPVMFAASALCILLMRDSAFDRGEGLFLTLGLVLFTAYAVHLGRKELPAEEVAEYAEEIQQRSLSPGRGTLPVVGAILGGIALLVLGGRLLVDGASSLARYAGMSERMIGLTVVAVGTGMPELATSVVAAARRQTDVAVANMIGSNIFNLLGILGITALVHPFRFSAAIAGSDLWWMLAVSALLLPVLGRRMEVVRWEGGLLVGAYVAYLLNLILFSA
jgi:cation:H+ antiporter